MKKKLLTGLACGLISLGIIGLAEAAPTNIKDSSGNKRLITSDGTHPVEAYVETEGMYGQSKCNADPEEQLKPFLAEFGLNELPEPFVPPNITFELAVQTGKLLYVSGNGPALPTGGFITGKVPTQLTVEEAKRAARLTAINQLAVIKKKVGSLKQVKRIVKLFGMVNAESDFTNHPTIINGASDLLVAVFGECGYHARSAVGMASLPFGIPVEIDMVVELEDKQN